MLRQPGVSDVEMEQLVNEKVDIFWRGIEGGANKRGQVGQVVLQSPMISSTRVQIDVTFSEKRPKKSWFQVYMGEEDVPWEQWCVLNSQIRVVSSNNTTG
jgi:hypothetical protein